MPAVAAALLLFTRGHGSATHSTSAAQEVGAWGTLNYMRVEVGAPPGFVTASLCRTAQPDWRLPGVPRERVLEVLEAAGVTSEQRGVLDRSLKCDAASQVCVVSPPPEFVASLSPSTRKTLYELLMKDTENARAMMRYRRHESEGVWSEADGLTEEMRRWLEPLLYHDGPWTFFADMPLICSRLSTDPEKARFVEGLMHRSAVLAWLKFSPDTDIEALLRYWQPAERHEDLRPLFESLARAPGSSLDIINLLPRFARARVNTFANPEETPASCAWTALNFFSDDEASGTLVTQNDVELVLQRDYAPVTSDERRLGDMLVWRDGSGQIIHAANYIAGDLVFTKNGLSFRRPWILSTLDDVRLEYPYARQLDVYRRR